MKRLKLRKKLLISQLILVGIFVFASFPIGERTIRNLVFESLDINTQDLIDELINAENEAAMIHELKIHQQPIFYRITLYDDKGNILYDAQLSNSASKNFVPYYPPTKEAILDALKEKRGFTYEESLTNKKKVLFFLNSFPFQGKEYLLRTAIVYSHVDILQRNFNAWFITFSLVTWLFFSGLTWLILYRLHRPIQHIIDAIRPYQSGNRNEIPEIIISSTISEDDEFKQLALTLNSLSSRVKEQLSSLTDERNEKAAILDSLEEGVIDVDGSDIIRYVNEAAAKFLALEKTKLKSKNYHEASQIAKTPLLNQCKEILEECQKKQFTIRRSVVVMNQKRIFLDIIATPKEPSQGAIIVIQDTSIHHKVLEMGKDFVANASHELRTPITIIKGFAETLQDMPTLPKPMLVDITEKIVRNCQRMDNLIHNLLLLADIENMQASRLRECDLVGLVEDSIEMTKGIYPDAHITLQKNKENIYALAEPDLLELAIINLVHNAAKYSNPPAEITIRVEQGPQDLKISVSDKGIGIPPQDLEHVFERFFTVDKAHSRKLGGAGLGLSIVKTIIEKHEGTVHVSSELGMGSTFTIRLPFPKKSMEKKDV